MFEIKVPTRKFTVSSQQITFPEYRDASGNPCAVEALIYAGTPYFSVVKTVQAISGIPTTNIGSVYRVLLKIIKESRYGLGTLIFTPRGGVFADPQALKNILATMFLDVRSAETQLKQNAIPTRGPHAGVRPKFRTITNPELYDAIMSSAHKLISVYSAARNQISPLCLETVSPAVVGTGLGYGAIAAAKIKRSTKSAEPEVIDDKNEIATDRSHDAAASESKAVAPQTADISGKAGLDLVSGLVSIGAQATANPLLELIKQLAAGKSLTIKISID